MTNIRVDHGSLYKDPKCVETNFDSSNCVTIIQLSKIQDYEKYPPK